MLYWGHILDRLHETGHGGLTGEQVNSGLNDLTRLVILAVFLAGPGIRGGWRCGREGISR